MPATIDQNLLPNAIVEFHTARKHGKSETDAWLATVARIRYDVLRLAIAALTPTVSSDDAGAQTRKDCILTLVELQESYPGEPSQLV